MERIEPLKKRYLNLIETCNYTGLTPDQIDYAGRRGLLKPSINKSGGKSWEVSELDSYMTAGKSKKVG